MTLPKVYRQEAQRLAAADEDDAEVEEAVKGIRNGTWKNPRIACEALGCSTSKMTTIYRRLKGQTKPRKLAHAPQQLLNQPQEKVLLAWVKFLSASGTPLSKRTIAPKVEALCGKKPSRRWVYRFLRRHVECVMSRPSGLDQKRARAFNYHNVNTYFERLQRTIDLNEIPWENLYNMDEVGIQLGGGRKGNGEVYLFSAADKSRYLQKSDDLELVTVIESVCGDGSSSVRPCFVFAGSKMCKEWFDVDGEILCGTTENGWTSESMCRDWFEKTFVPAAKAHGDASKPILLLFDGHSSHTTVDIIDIARKNNIIMFELPPHTTHRLQPCDVGVFSPLKREWNKRAQEVFDNTGQPLQAKDVVRVYWDARNAAFKENTIRQAFTKSGLVRDSADAGPRCDIGQFTEQDFAPSIPTSTTLHLPEGFPTSSHLPVTCTGVLQGNSSASAGCTSLTEALPERVQKSSSVNSDGSSSEDGTDDEEDSDMEETTQPGTLLTQDVHSAHQGSVRPRSSSPHDIGSNPFLADSTSSPLITNSISVQVRPQTRSVARSEIQPVNAPPTSDSEDETSPVLVIPTRHHGNVDSDEEADRLANTPRSMRRLLDKRKTKLDRLRFELDEANSHATLMRCMVGDLKNQLNKRKKKNSGRTINVGGRVVTSEEGRAIALAQQLAREEKENKADELRQKRLLADAAQLQRRKEMGQEGMVFTGALVQQKRPVLQDIAWCMNLSQKGTREELTKRISTHVEEQPILRTDHRFAGLWPPKRGSKRGAPPSSGTEAGPSTSHTDRPTKRARIDDVSDIPMELYREEGSGISGPL